MTILQIPTYISYLSTRLFIQSSVRVENGRLQHPLIISNHVHLLDPFLIISQFSFSEIRKILPIYTITANKYVIGKWYSPLIRAIGCFPAQKNPKGLPYGLDASIHYASQGSLMIFPEGARSTVHKIERLRSGASVIAHQANKLVLPIYIEKNPKKLFRSFTIVRGATFDATDMNIEQMMEKVWELKPIAAQTKN